MSATAVLFKAEPKGAPVPDETFEVAKVDVATPQDGEVLVKLIALSVDPYMRGKMRQGFKSYTESFNPGEPMYGDIVVQVVESKRDSLKVGQLLKARGKWVTLQVLNEAQLKMAMPLQEGETPELALSILGLTGLTAYHGLEEIGQVKEGETVVVSGAAGATGQIVVQLAKLKGARVIGIAGGPEKVAHVKSLGADDAIDYRNENIGERLDALAPKGVDVYWDNVGGETLQAVFARTNTFARIIACGAISQYNDAKAANLSLPNALMIIRRITWRGFIVFDFVAKFKDSLPHLGQLVKEGKLKNQVTITNGFEKAGEAFAGLFSGANLGKAIVLA